MEIETVRQFWDFYRKQRDDIPNFDTFYVHFFGYDFWGPHKKRMNCLLNSGISEPILDAGCGSGWVSFALNQHGFKPLCVDLLEKQVSQSNLFFTYFGLEGRVVQSDIAALPFADGFFSAVIAFDVLEHIKDIDKILAEIRRVIKREGTLFVTVPNGWGSYGLLEDRFHKMVNLPLRRVIRRIFLGDKKTMKKEEVDTHHMHLRGMSWWRNRFKCNGFMISNITNIEFVSTYLFSRLGYEKFGTWSQRDAQLAEKLPAWLASEWLFQLALSQ